MKTHVSHFNAHMLQGLHHHCPGTKKEPKKKLIWALRASKLSLKKRFTSWRQRNRDETLLGTLMAWQHGISADPSHLNHAHQLWHYDRTKNRRSRSCSQTCLTRHLAHRPYTTFDLWLDQIHSAFCKVAPYRPARNIFFCQMLKTMMRGQEALSHKGGFPQPL